MTSTKYIGMDVHKESISIAVRNGSDPNAAVLRASLAWADAMKRMYPQACAEYDKTADQGKV